MEDEAYEEYMMLVDNLFQEARKVLKEKQMGNY